MDHAGFVCGLEAAGDLTRQPQSASDRQLPVPPQDGGEVVALHVRHRDVFDAVDLAEVVNAHHVLVRDLAGEEQLVLEPLFGLGRRAAAPAVRANDLERDGDAELGVPGLIHCPHPAGAQQLDDVIARTERLSDLEWSVGVRRGISRGAIGRRIARRPGGRPGRLAGGPQAGGRAERRARRQAGRVNRNDTRRDRRLGERGATGLAAAGGRGHGLATAWTNHWQSTEEALIIASSPLPAKGNWPPRAES